MKEKIIVCAKAQELFCRQMSDPNSFANLAEVKQTHVSFAITIDFEKQVTHLASQINMGGV